MRRHRLALRCATMLRPRIPQAVRRLAPDRMRHDPRLRAVAVGTGLIPPRTMHTAGEAQLLTTLASGRDRVVELGVYEGSSALVLLRALGPGAALHLVDPFGHHPGALRAGWAATEGATRRVLARAAGAPGAARVEWHVERSEDAARHWTQPVDLVFVDGDHTEAACALDWELWHPHVRPGGHVVFHDARSAPGSPPGLPGPTAVVDRLFRDAATPGWELAQEVDRAVAVRRVR
jgi:predicted O-methyltransferase YrrM